MKNFAKKRCFHFSACWIGQTRVPEKKIHEPNPLWKPGDPIESPVQAMSAIDFTKLDSTPAYKLMTGAIVPRPIALVSTQDLNGVVNVAPFSFFTGVSSHPPCLLLSITRKPDGGKKDTLLNIEATRSFVVNTVSSWMAGPMNYCSAEFPYGVSELEKSGFTAVPSLKVAPPRIAQSPIHMECELYALHEVGEGDLGSATLVVGRIVMMHVDERAYDPKRGRINVQALEPLARLAGFSYGLSSGIFEIARPKI